MSDSLSRKKIVILLGLFVASVFVYLPTVGYSFVWDDTIVLSSEIHGVKGYGLFFGGGDYYRPFLALCHGLDYALWGAHPAGFHLTNVLLNAFCTPLVFLVALSLFGEEKILPAVVSALFFMLHPVHAESVAWISGRTDIIASLFFFLAFLSYITYRENNEATGLVLSVLFFLFALFGKESAFLYPLVLLAYDNLVRGKRIKDSLFPMAVHLFVVLIYFSLRKFPHIAASPNAAPAYGAAAGQAGGMSASLRELWYSLGYYVNKLVFPFHVSIFPDVDRSINIVMLLVSLVVIAFVYFKKKALPLFGLAFIILALLPSLPVIFMRTVPTPVAARYLYLPAFGLSISLAWTIDRMGRKRVVAALLVSIVIVAYSFGLYARLGDWKNDLSLWSSEVRENPYSASARALLAITLYDNNRYDESEKEINYTLARIGSLRMNPGVKKDLIGNMLNTRGLISMHREDFSGAEKDFIIALTYDKHDRSAYHNLGSVYLSQYLKHNERKLLEEANFMYAQASATDPLFLQSKYGLAYTSELLGRKQQAVKYYREIIDLDPGNPMARMAMKAMLAMEGR